MIFYVTKETAQRYKILFNDEIVDPETKVQNSSIIEAEKDSGLYEWGVKLFYLNGMKCLQAINYASKFTVALYNVKNSDLKDLWNKIAFEVLEAYQDDPETYECLKRRFVSHQVVAWERISNKSVITQLTSNEKFISIPEYLEGYTEKGIYTCEECTQYLNFKYPISLKFLGSNKLGFSGEVLRGIISNEKK